MMNAFYHHSRREAAKKATTTVTLLFSRKFVFKSGDNDDDDDVYESFSLDDPLRNVLDDDLSSGNFFIGHHEKNGRGLYASRDVTKNESIFKKKKKKNDNNNNKAGGGTEGRQKPITSHPTIWITIWSVTCAWESSQRRRRTTTTTITTRKYHQMGDFAASSANETRERVFTRRNKRWI